MFLTANDIRDAVGSGQVVIEPFEASLLKPASYVLRFSNKWRRWIKSDEPILVWSGEASKNHLSPVETADEVLISPGEFVLASTTEAISLPRDLVGWISTLSHLARFGISIHNDSFLVSPNFGAGEPTPLTLEIHSTNPSPLRIKSGTPACHLAFARATSNPAAEIRLRKSIYEGREAPCEPMLYEEFTSNVPPGVER